MIVVTVGTNEARFDRLLAAVEHLSPGPRMLVQHGPSPIRPAGAVCVDYLLFDDLATAIREADAVITHAGVGSIMTALANGKRPIVVPRLKRYGEAVDDHQLPFARRLAATGLVRLVEDLGRLADALAQGEDDRKFELGPDRRLVSELRDYLTARIDAGNGYSR